MPFSFFHKYDHEHTNYSLATSPSDNETSNQKEVVPSHTLKKVHVNVILFQFINVWHFKFILLPLWLKY